MQYCLDIFRCFHSWCLERGYEVSTLQMNLALLSIAFEETTERAVMWEPLSNDSFYLATGLLSDIHSQNAQPHKVLFKRLSFLTTEAQDSPAKKFLLRCLSAVCCVELLTPFVIFVHINVAKVSRQRYVSHLNLVWRSGRTVDENCFKIMSAGAWVSGRSERFMKADSCREYLNWSTWPVALQFCLAVTWGFSQTFHGNWRELLSRRFWIWSFLSSIRTEKNNDISAMIFTWEGWVPGGEILLLWLELSEVTQRIKALDTEQGSLPVLSGYSWSNCPGDFWSTATKWRN